MILVMTLELSHNAQFLWFNVEMVRVKKNYTEYDATNFSL